jgi:hypothetical protein
MFSFQGLLAEVGEQEFGTVEIVRVKNTGTNTQRDALKCDGACLA